MLNFYIDKNIFPSGFKKADIKPVYKKGDPFDKTNYRPISILPVLCKGSSIKYVRKIFRKTNISNSLIHTAAYMIKFINILILL